MQALHYQVTIDAGTASVWDSLTDTNKYNQWVKAFSANSYMQGEWIAGTSVKFLDPDMGGTKAIIEQLEPERHILLRHVAVISKEGEESSEGEMADKWIGTIEEYILQAEDGKTSLQINIETHVDFVEMFESAWPTAIDHIKTISEAA